MLVLVQEEMAHHTIFSKVWLIFRFFHEKFAEFVEPDRTNINNPFRTAPTTVSIFGRTNYLKLVRNNRGSGKRVRI